MTIASLPPQNHINALRAFNQPHPPDPIDTVKGGRVHIEGRFQGELAADVVVLAADPAADVGNGGKVVEVFKDGKVFRAGAGHGPGAR